MTNLTVLYPWSRLKKGEGFFIPSLDPETTRRELLIDALKHRVYGKATVGIKGGKLGVLFVLGPRARVGSQQPS